MPQPQLAAILQAGGQTNLQLAGGSEAVRVRQLFGVTESHIEDVFEGWQGDSTYKLTNGQAWKQTAYKYEYS